MVCCPAPIGTPAPFRDALTLVGGQSTMWTRPCPGRGTCSGGPRGPPGGVLRVVTSSSTLKLPAPRQFRPRRDEFRTMRALSSGLSCVTLLSLLSLLSLTDRQHPLLL